MIDLATEHRIGLHEGAKLYPSFREGRPTHVSTVLRHITKGVRLPDGQIVHLEGARLGGRWITSVEAVQRFMERLTAGALGDIANMPNRPSRGSKQRQRDLARVDADLRRAGL
jgi:hypothetical protein